MEYIILIATLIVVFLFLFGAELVNGKRREAYIKEELNKSFGKFSDRKYDPSEFERIKKYFYRFKNENSIDDITANDLGIDDIFMKFNLSNSAMGSEVFYNMLRSPEGDENKLKRLDEQADVIKEDSGLRENLQFKFYKIGSRLKVSLLDCLDLFEDIENKSVFKDVLSVLLLFVSIGLIFFFPTAGILCLIGTLVYNILTYYKERGNVDAFIVCFSYIINFLMVAREFSSLNSDAFSVEKERIAENEKKLRAFENLSFLVSKKTTGIGSGNPLDILMDYIRMIFHVDIIAFYKMLSLVKKEKDAIITVYSTLGYMEALVSIASVRSFLTYVKPENGLGISGVNMYHPLISDPVKNDFSTEKNVLITGSNASGKSTFLKMMALNVLFSKTIYTCFADKFVTDDYFVLTSMSLRDDLMSHDSYFMVEIKAIKRIIEYAEAHPEKKVLIFVDEVLRGTNTVERIAASSEILKEIPANSLCFAATHDIELTYILEGQYANFHFNENVVDDDVLFEYKIKEGRATSQNAIKLLSIMGFSETIVDNARFKADQFIKTGEWQ